MMFDSSEAMQVVVHLDRVDAAIEMVGWMLVACVAMLSVAIVTAAIIRRRS